MSHEKFIRYIPTCTYSILCTIQTLQENELFPRANTLGNTQNLSEKFIFEWDMPSILVVLSLFRNVEFLMSRRRKKLFPKVSPSKIEVKALGNKIR